MISFIAQRLDRIEIGGLLRRIDAEKEPNASGNEKPSATAHHFTDAGTE